MKAIANAMLDKTELFLLYQESLVIYLILSGKRKERLALRHKDDIGLKTVQNQGVGMLSSFFEEVISERKS